MAEIVVQYPDELLKATRRSREDIEREMRFQLAVRMFQLGELSLGQQQDQFADELGKNGIPVINLDEEQNRSQRN